MRILKLFKKHILALFAAIVLIVISCNADLALPTYMSDIVDVGVQQGGIASPVPDTIRAESLDDLELFMSAKGAKAVEAVFSKADNNGIRTYKGTEKERADGGKIADIMSLPETVVLAFNQGIDADSMGDMMGASTETRQRRRRSGHAHARADGGDDARATRRDAAEGRCGAEHAKTD
ncbi:MAG: hypothetical protein ACLU7D_01250 [Collinsella sp.]